MLRECANCDCRDCVMAGPHFEHGHWHLEEDRGAWLLPVQPSTIVLAAALLLGVLGGIAYWRHSR